MCTEPGIHQHWAFAPVTYDMLSLLYFRVHVPHLEPYHYFASLQIVVSVVSRAINAAAQVRAPL